MFQERVLAAAIVYWSVTGLNVQEEFLSLTDEDDLSKLKWVLEKYAEPLITIDEDVRKRLREDWTAVEALASALLDKGTLEYAEVEAILSDKINKRDV